MTSEITTIVLLKFADYYPKVIVRLLSRIFEVALKKVVLYHDSLHHVPIEEIPLAIREAS